MGGPKSKDLTSAQRMAVEGPKYKDLTSAQRMVVGGAYV